MKCPVCKVDMIVVEYRKIELDYCVRCAGVWFDAGELALLMNTMGINTSLSQSDLLHPGEAKVAEQKRHCPICGQKMKKAFVGKEPKALIDACPREEGLWFDGGELGHVITQLGDKPPAERDAEGVLPFLRDAFSGSQNR